MASTYEIIRALPGKSYNWAGFNAALEALLPNDADTRHSVSNGARTKREAAMFKAAWLVHNRSVKATFLPASQETLSWGGFLGGETVVTTDQDAEEAATTEIAALARQFA